MFCSRPRSLNQWGILLLLALQGISAFSADKSYFPSSVKICRTKDSNFNTCFTDSVNRMLKYLAKGMRNLNAVPMDPLYIPLMHLEQNNALVPTLAFNYSETYHEGWKDAVMISSNINPQDEEFNMVFLMPRYYFRGNYQITGAISGIPLEGSGDFEFTFYNWTNNMLMHGHLEERRQEKYFVIDDFEQKTHVGKMVVKFNNLFNNTELSDATNNVMNQNDRVVLDEANELMNELWGAIHKPLLQRIFNSVPYRFLFPDLD